MSETVYAWIGHAVVWCGFLYTAVEVIARFLLWAIDKFDRSRFVYRALRREMAIREAARDAAKEASFRAEVAILTGERACPCGLLAIPHQCPSDAAKEQG